ncbi:MAG: DUF368 domain-containing protein [Erysipelotrichales bacterium]|nr:DUF368 domain-containing protein [Erysipelotrichales bacterium]
MKTQIKSFKDFLIIALKGLVVGIAMLIPGISGGTLALSMGVYEDIIESVTGIKKHFKDSILFLIPLAIGALIGYIALVKIVELGLRYIPIPTITLFVGFIIGSLPSIYRNVKGEKITPKNIICFVVALLIAAGLGVVSRHLGLTVNADNLNAWSYILIAIGGIFASFALVVPGISGSAVLLALGLYELIVIESIPNVIKDLLSFKFGSNLLIVAIFAIGAIIGLVSIVVLMKYLLNKHKVPTFFAILGFIVGSVFSVYYNHEVFNEGYYNILIKNPWQFALVIAMLAIGIALALVMDKLGSKHKVDKIEN